MNQPIRIIVTSKPIEYIEGLTEEQIIKALKDCDCSVKVKRVERCDEDINWKEVPIFEVTIN